MRPRDEHRRLPAPKPAADLSAEELSDKERGELADDAKQAAYRRAYLAQLRARQCPDCGESELF